VFAPGRFKFDLVSGSILQERCLPCLDDAVLRIAELECHTRCDVDILLVLEVEI
jgi:hypothetical protein